ncbi:DNA repair and recombination protein RadB [[Eubacterium] cellulosolvens]
MTGKLQIDCRAIDDLLGGGIEAGAVTEFYGEGGAGKTNICLQLSMNCVLQGKKPIFIDTEGVSFERLEQICGKRYSKIYPEIIFFSPFSLSDQEQMVQEAVKIIENSVEIGLLVLDSGTVFYRMSLGCEDEQVQRQNLSRQIILILANARKFDLPVVITNQVFHDIESGVLSPIGGHILYHNAKAIIRLDRVTDNVRRATIIKHRSLAEGLNCEFKITNKGIEDL